MTQKKQLLIACFVSIVVTGTHGQKPQFSDEITHNSKPHEQCAHTTIHEGLMVSDPTYRLEQEKREHRLNTLIAQHRAGFIPKSDEVLTIPVVVHIIHTGQAYGVDANIDDEQVYSAVMALNDDFRKVPGTWGDGEGVDTKVEFCLAQRDPNGNAHSGINRVNGCSISLYCNEGITAGNGQGANELDVKNLSRWPNQQYYNIWVVTEIENNNGGSGIQGYAYFPTSSSVDGTVVLYNAFGTEGTLKSYTNRNKTLTHELGHAFALFHTFQGDSCSESDCDLQGDRVCDTPPTVLSSSCNAPACGGTQQIENYLDYTNQTCKNMFTQGQMERMRLSIENSRPNLLISNACQPVSSALADASIAAIHKPFGNTCSNIIEPVMRLSNAGTMLLTSATIQYRTSGTWQNYSWSGILGQGQGADIILPSLNGGWGTQTLQVQVTNPNGGADSNASNNLLTQEYIAIQNGHHLELTVVIDNLGSQSTWELRNTSAQIIASGGPYANFQSGMNHTTQICVVDGCYDFVMMDSGNNGMCCFNGNGSYTLTNSAGTVLASGSTFTSQQTTNFCLSSGGPPQANFSANNTSICAGGSVSFTNLTEGNVDSYEWTFAGGTPAISTLANPGNIQYNTSGTFAVKLKAINEFGYTEELKTSYITVAANSIWYADADGDGYGNASVSLSSCMQPQGYENNAMDCDDNDNSNWNSCYDCNGVMNGTSSIDACGVCDDNPENDCEPCATLTATVASIENPSCYGASDGAIELLVTSQGGNYTVQWSNGMSGTNITGLSTGQYTAHIVDNNCTILIDVSLDQPSALEVTFVNITHVGCEETNTGASEFEISGGTTPYLVYYGNLLLSQNSFNGLSPGLYTLEVNDASGCELFTTLEILQISCNNLPITQVEDSFCESQTSELSIPVSCEIITEAEGYEWKFTTQAGDDHFLFTSSAAFVPLEFEFLLPNATYEISVRGVHASMQSEFGASCTMVFTIASTVLNMVSCGNEQMDLLFQAGCNPISYAQGYEFRFEDASTLERFYYQSISTNFTPAEIPDIETGTLYNVTVRATYKNIWGNPGANCSLMLSEVIEVTQLTSEWCNNMEINIQNDTLRVQPLEGKDVYELHISNGDIDEYKVIQSTDHQFPASDIEGLTNGLVYSARARAFSNGNWTPWGASCSIGITETEANQLNMLIYPNPALVSDKVNILMNGDWQDLDLSIQSISGVNLHHAKVNVTHQVPFVYDGPKLQPGFYLVTAKHQDQVLSAKLIIQ